MTKKPTIKKSSAIKSMAKTPKGQKPNFTYSKTDQDLWEKMTRTVKPRQNVADDKEFFATIEEEKKASAVKTLQKIESMNLIATPKKEQRISTLPPIVIDRQADIDAATFSKLTKGRMKIESRLDLHGMTRDTAWAELRTWLPACQRAGMRCVLVITGKGTGALQSSLPNFINRPELRPYILSCTKASPKHGGSGAFYIYLKK